MYAKLTELMTDFDISIRATMKGKKHNIKEKSITVVNLKAFFSLKNFLWLPWRIARQRFLFDADVFHGKAQFDRR